MQKEFTRADFPILDTLEEGNIVTIAGYPLTDASELEWNLNQFLKPDHKFVVMEYDGKLNSATFTLKSTTVNDEGLTVFDNDEDAKAYWWDLGKHGLTEAIISGKKVVLCGTCLVYEDELWGHCNEVLEDHEDESSDYNGLIGSAASLLSDLVDECMEIQASDITQDEYDKFCDIIAERDENCREDWEEDAWRDDCLTFASSQFRDLAIQVFERVSGLRILDVSDSY